MVVLLWLLFLLSFSFAGNVSQKNRETAEIIMTALEKNFSKETVIGQISKYEKLINAFWMVKFRDNNQREMITYLVECLKKKVNKLKSQVETQDQVISNVDRDRVQRDWLSWHNEERENLWLKPYKINSTLNYSSLIRAQELAHNLRTWYTHSRDSLYDSYNYDKILNWFNNLWITFNYKRTAFTENITYQYYVCNKSDCTQEMINALRKWFDFFMKEKSYDRKHDGPHYRAIAHEYFDQLWFWVATNWKYCWVVTHYGINVK